MMLNITPEEAIHMRFALLTRKARLANQLRICYEVLLDTPQNRAAIEHLLFEDACLISVLMKLDKEGK